MNNKILTIILVIIFFAIFFGLMNFKQHKEPIKDISSISGIVSDKETKQPIEDVLVYLGRDGYWNSKTDEKGNYLIKGFVYGDYGIIVFKKGYKRFVSSLHTEKGKNVFNMELEKKDLEPEQVLVKGIVTKEVHLKRTLSEYTTITLKENGNEYFLFNDYGLNEGFDDFIDEKVSVEGFREIGFIGWMGREEEGIYVEGITRI